MNRTPGPFHCLKSWESQQGLCFTTAEAKPLDNEIASLVAKGCSRRMEKHSDDQRELMSLQ